MRSIREVENDLAARTRELNPLVVRYMEGGLDGDDLATFRSLKGDVESLQGELADANIAEGQRRDDLAFAETASTLNRHYNQPTGQRASGQVPGDGSQRGEERPAGRTMGEQFVNSDQFRQYRESGVGRGTSSAPFRVEQSLMEQRALITSTVVTSMILPDRQPGIYGPEMRPLLLRDALANGRTDSNLVEFVTEASRTNNAAEVAEATSLVDGAKPESGFTLAVDNAPVRTIATLMYVTRQALDDMSGLRSYIDGLLARFIDERVDRQLLVGNGTPPNLKGLNNVSGVLNLNGAYWAANGGITNKLDRIRRSKTRVRIGGRGVASLVIVNPADLETFETMKVDGVAGQNQYVLPNGGPFGNGTIPTIWGMRALEHEDQTAGIATVLDGRACMVMDRMDTQLFLTDSNRDLFERNILTLLVETRLAFPIFYPGRIALVDLVATS